MSFKIGVDGGASKTECILVDPSGAVVGRRLAPGCNPNVTGADSARAAVSAALSSLLTDLPGGSPRGGIAATLLCMAGPVELWREFAAGLSGFGRVRAVDDSLPVLELATGGGPGIVLHAGTGSFVAARGPANQVGYAGGLGWRLGDEGSGYDIGRRAIARGLLELQGWEAPSELAALIRRQTRLSEAAAITRHFYADPSAHAQVAALAPEVLALAAGGDPAALAVAVESTRGLLDLAAKVSARLFPGGAPGAGLSGPILTHPAVMPALIRLAPFPLRAVVGQPIDGVRAMLARM
jgi:N-acetylglucosamine kinase-like BadF-type ATPase